MNVHHIKMHPFKFDMILLTEGHPYWEPTENSILCFHDEDFDNIKWTIVEKNMTINEHKDAVVLMVFEEHAQIMYDLLFDIETQSKRLMNSFE